MRKLLLLLALVAFVAGCEASSVTAPDTAGSLQPADCTKVESNPC